MSEELDLSKYQSMLDAMGIDTDEDSLANVPAPIVSFGAGSLIGKWNAFVGYYFMSQEDDIILRNSGTDVPQPDLRKEVSGWFHYYFRSYEAANEAYEAMGQNPDYSPDNVWVFFAPTTDIIVQEERRDNFMEAFGELVIFHVLIKRLNKATSSYPAKNRHSYNLISLPCAVAAMADLLEMENPGFDVTELMLAEADTLEAAEKDDSLIYYDDELFARLFGDIEGDYQDAEYYGRRKRLWAALGESDPRKQAMKGSKTARGRPHSLATNSDRLNFCLSIAQGRWTSSRWAEITSLHNPLPGAVSASGNRLTIPAITRLFSSEADARAFFAETTGEEGDEGQGGGTAAPENWKGVPLDQWLQALAEKEGTPPPVAAQDLYCTPAEVNQWRQDPRYVQYKEENGL